MQLQCIHIEAQMTKFIPKLKDINLRQRDLIAAELVDGRHVVLHVIRQPLADEPGFYRSAVSGNAFKERETKIWYDRYYTKRKVMPRQFSVMYSFDFQIEKKIMLDRDSDHEWHTLPILEHESIWEFYKHVGYDHKKKKYIQQGII